MDVDRRRAFAAATLRLTAGGGLEAVSMRSVASEAGWSTGALQKCFATKDDLLVAAIDLMSEHVTDRMARLPVTGDLAVDVAALIRETLPLDADRREEALVWSAVAGRAAVVPWMAEVLARQDSEVLAALTAEIRAARPAEPDPAAVASALVALADGWAVRLLYRPDCDADVVRALDRALELLLPSER